MNKLLFNPTCQEAMEEEEQETKNRRIVQE